jgi:iron(III) transport system substrate-binding protein
MWPAHPIRRPLGYVPGLLALVSILAIACAPAAPPAPAAAPAAKPEDKAAPKQPQDTWESMATEARKEGTVVVVTNPGQTYRDALASFTKAFPGVSVEVLGGFGGDASSRVVAERGAGQFLLDVWLAGIPPVVFDLLPIQAVVPLKPVLLSEIQDDSKWRGGFDAGWRDAGKQLIYAFQGEQEREFFVNRAVVPEWELNSVEQLVEPKWKGKISWFDPRRTGGGNGPAAHVLYRKGEPFLRQLLANDLTLTADPRQQLDWLVRGQYPVTVGVSNSLLNEYQGLGLTKDVAQITMKDGLRSGGGTGAMALMDRAPHPNAAKLFANWLLSKDGQTAWAESNQRNVRRTDVPVANPELAEKPGVDSIALDGEQTIQYFSKALEIAKEVLQ